MTRSKFALSAALAAAALASAAALHVAASAVAAPAAEPYGGARALADASAQRRARAGRPFTARVSFDAARIGERVTLQKLSCRVAVRGRVVRKVTRRLRGEVAGCTWRLPRWAKGRRLRGHIALRTERVSVRLSFARTVR